MLPPVQALSRSATSYQDSANDATPSGTAAVATDSDAMVRVDREGGSAIAGRINNLLLSGREGMQTNLADIADLVGGAIGLTRNDGESDAAFAQRFANALGTLDDSQRMRLQTQLNHALKGLQLDVLLRVLQNTDGPEAALLSAYMEIQRNNDGDLKARTVVSSYSQNGASASPPLLAPVRPTPAPVAIQAAGANATPHTESALGAAMADEASAPAAAVATVAAKTSVPASQSPQVPSGSATNPQSSAAYQTEGDGTASETAQAGAFASETTEAQVEAQDQSAIRQSLADTSRAAASAAVMAGQTEAVRSQEIASIGAGTNTVGPLDQADESAMDGADVGQAPGELDLPGKAPAGSDTPGTIVGAKQTVPSAASRTALADDALRAGLNTGSAATEPDQPTESTTMRTANRAYEVITGMASGKEEPVARPRGRDDALERLSTSVLALKGWMEIVVAGPHAVAEADKAEENDLLRQIFFQVTEEPEHSGDDLLDRANTGQTLRQAMLGTPAPARQQTNDAVPASRIKAAPATGNLASNEVARAGGTPASEAEAQLAIAQQEKIVREPAVLSLTGAQAMAHAIPVQVPQFVPLPIVSYLAMQDEADANKTESVDAVEALNEDDPHQGNSGQQNRERGEDKPPEEAEDDADALSSDHGTHGAISNDADLEMEWDHRQEPASAPTASILTLPAPSEEDFQAESLYWRIADLA
ncbi:hypothetical protein [Allorhizobium taibaishanense]|nr:hypothetical protein [Allorhizobium taibaishanense]MBB4009727.1 hypothetical protein [Allorhizobium taibaishanense]